jgi:periplasmic copper chaperone A
MRLYRYRQKAGPAARRFRGSILFLGVLVAALTARGTAQAAEQGIAVHDPWMRTVIPSRPAAGYFTLSNGSDKPVALVGAASPACGMLMLHQSIQESGQDRMVMVKSIPVPAHGEVKFAPGGYHLMCMSPSNAVSPGNSVSVELRFEDGGTVTANFPVRGATGE